MKEHSGKFIPNVAYQQFVSSFGANHFQFAISPLRPTCIDFSIFATASGVYPEIFPWPGIVMFLYILLCRIKKWNKLTYQQ